MEVNIPSDFENYIEKVYQDLVSQQLHKDPILLNSIKILMSEDPKFKLDPKFGLSFKHLEKLADDLVTKMYKDRPEMREFFDRIRGIPNKNLVQDFAAELEKSEFDFKALEFHPNRLEETHLKWLEQQSFLSLDPPLIQKKKDKIGLPILLVFDQFRNDFNFLIEVFFKPYIQTILKQDPEDLHYRDILSEVMKEDDSLWNQLSVEDFSIVRNSIVRNHFLFSKNKDIIFFTQREGLKKKIRLNLSRKECLRLALILNQSIWLLMLTWINTKNLVEEHPIPEFKDKIKEIKDIWIKNDLLQKRLDHFSQTRFGKAIKNQELEITLSIGRYSPPINRQMKMNYLQETITYFLGSQGLHINEFFRLSLVASNRIAYMYAYNAIWTEYWLPIGKWLLEQQGMTQSRYFDIWKELLDYSNGKYTTLFNIFSPIIRNAFVHGEYYQQEDHSYLFYSIEYPEYSPLHINPGAINLFQLKTFFDRYLHPNSYLGFEKFGLAKHWIDLIEDKKKTTDQWQGQIREMEKLGYNVLEIMMRTKLISEKLSSASVNTIQEDIEKLFKDRLVVINDLNLLVLAVVSLFLNNREYKQLYILMEQITNLTDEFFLLNPKILSLFYKIQIYLAKNRKAWIKAKNLQKKVKKLETDKK